MAKSSRLTLRRPSTAQVHLQYLVFPYADFHIGPLGQENAFKLGPFLLWRDTPNNWQQFLATTRPAEHLAMYRDMDGVGLTSMWIATPNTAEIIDSERWQHLASVLLFLAWAYIPFVTIDRAAAEDLYSEAFVVPEGASLESRGHVRWSKYGSQFLSEVKLYPVPEVWSRGIHIQLPSAHLEEQDELSPFHNPIPSELFIALDQELLKSESPILTALWFLFEASYRSAFRSGFAEDVQNICTAFEALLGASKVGYSSEQVAEKIANLFRDRSPTFIEQACSESPYSDSRPERQEVLDKLRAWVEALYNLRNAYTHGKRISHTDYIFGHRSIWQDAFEIFSLTATRVILRRPERAPQYGSQLEKLLMSLAYADEAVAFFSERDEWMNVNSQSSDTVSLLQEIIRKSKALDPQRVESISSKKRLRQTLFNLCTVVCRALQQAASDFAGRGDGAELQSLLDHLIQAYPQNTKLDIDAYIRAVSHRISQCTAVLPIAGEEILLLQLCQAFKQLLNIYQNFRDVH